MELNLAHENVNEDSFTRIMHDLVRRLAQVIDQDWYLEKVFSGRSGHLLFDVESLRIQQCLYLHSRQTLVLFARIVRDQVQKGVRLRENSKSEQQPALLAQFLHINATGCDFFSN